MPRERTGTPLTADFLPPLYEPINESQAEGAALACILQAIFSDSTGSPHSQPLACGFPNQRAEPGNSVRRENFTHNTRASRTQTRLGLSPLPLASL
jgi:hypothetical protein